MIVLDASVVVELLINGPLSENIRDRLAATNDFFVAPHLMDVEVVSALRNLMASGRIDSNLVDECLSRLAMLPAHRFPHTPLLARVWELRHNFTAHDAIYLALAEATGGTLFTTDGKLRKGHRSKVIFFE
ncbi:MAG: type II toxin-antitoxin system VapC family toxin [Bryobacterales bacterium]|nr:type II toxin-antitoxin system VapC family toxin [Bryobacterales bacterium]MBV9396892.1 type II toxin-antitoxin system VapC family toxin [Bryobacterales bacterium]